LRRLNPLLLPPALCQSLFCLLPRDRLLESIRDRRSIGTRDCRPDRLHNAIAIPVEVEAVAIIGARHIQWQSIVLLMRSGSHEAEMLFERGVSHINWGSSAKLTCAVTP